MWRATNNSFAVGPIYGVAANGRYSLWRAVTLLQCGFGRSLMQSTLVIRPAVSEDLPHCLALEELLSVERAEAMAQGFLRGGESLESYEEFLQRDIFYVAEKASVLSGFIVVLLPDSRRLTELRENQHAFETEQFDLFSRANLAWLAKIAVVPQWMRQGIGSSLLQQFYLSHPKMDIVTTVASQPQANEPALRFHYSQGFKKIGSFHAGDAVSIYDLLYRAAE